MLATIKQDGKFGAINLRGEIVVPCKYILEEAMISVPISNKVYRQKQEEVKNAKGNGDFDDLLDKIAECSREVNEKINNPGAEVITDSLRIREDNGKMGLVVGGQTVIPTEYEELIIAEDGFVLACKQDNIFSYIFSYIRSLPPFPLSPIIHIFFPSEGRKQTTPAHLPYAACKKAPGITSGSRIV